MLWGIVYRVELGSEVGGLGCDGVGQGRARWGRDGCVEMG